MEYMHVEDKDGVRLSAEQGEVDYRFRGDTPLGEDLVPEVLVVSIEKPRYPSGRDATCDCR